ncbi:MAG: HD-GYP domain-containing protein [Actinomycetota bacterium]|nr:HD-GYP domain-containing protein [Actinomycetota bacterium]
MALPAKLKVYILAVAVVAALLFICLALAAGEIFWPGVLLFGLLVLLSESLTVDLPRTGAISVSFTILFAAILVFGPKVAVLASLFGAIALRDIRRRVPWYRVIFNASQFVLSTGMASLVYVNAGGILLFDRGLSFADFPGIFLPLLLSALTFFILNTFSISIAIAFSEDLSPINAWLFNFKWLIPNYFALAALGVILAQVYVMAGAAGIVLLVMPLLVARETFNVYRKLRGAYEGTVRSLVKAIEAKDPYTAGHSERVADYAEKIARQLGMREDEVEVLKYAALLHDVGKMGVTKKILNKIGQLSDTEYKKVQEHPVIGANILKEIEFLKSIIPSVFHHHEHLNGRGYVDGLKGEEIPLMARILAVADSYDAMTSTRPYRVSLGKDEVVEELISCCGEQFDRTVIEAFLKVLGVEADFEEIISKAREGRSKGE